MGMKRLTPSILKRIIFEEKQRLMQERQDKVGTDKLMKEYQLLVLLERLDALNKKRSAKLREVKKVLKKRILRR